MLKVRFVLALFATITFVNCHLEENSYTEYPDNSPHYLQPNPTGYNAQGRRDNNINDVLLRYFNGKTLNDYVDIQLLRSEEILNVPTFNKECATVFYVHGYTETMESLSVKTIVDAYLLNQPNSQVIAIDWSNMAKSPYSTNAVPNTKKVGVAVATQLKKLLDRGLNLNYVHVVGHSLGGQIAGYIGKEIQRLGFKLKRITGLDSAFPLYYPGLLNDHINKNDADFVDIIHTDAGGYGAPVPTGTIDFWPNGGVRIQPGCPVGIQIPFSVADFCSHHRSWVYWAESLANPQAFPSLKAKNFHDYVDLTKKGLGPVVYMGIGADIGSSGNYYLTTNPHPPHGQGVLPLH